jgi:hypothetical protein
MLLWSALRDHNVGAEMARGEGRVPLLDPVGNDGASTLGGSSMSVRRDFAAGMDTIRIRDLTSAPAVGCIMVLWDRRCR